VDPQSNQREPALWLISAEAAVMCVVSAGFAPALCQFSACFALVRARFSLLVEASVQNFRLCVLVTALIGYTFSHLLRCSAKLQVDRLLPAASLLCGENRSLFLSV